MFWHTDTDFIALLVMCALYYDTKKMLPEDTYTTRNKSFIWCLRAGIIVTVIDIAASLIVNISISRMLYQLLMMLDLLTQNLVILLWIIYALTIIYEEDHKHRIYIPILCWSLYSIEAVLILSNPWTKFFFSLGPSLEYSRGPLFIPGFAGLNSLFFVLLLILVFLRGKRISSGYPKIVLIMQPFILGTAIYIQLANPGWLRISSAYMLCLVLAFLFFQNVRVHDEHGSETSRATNTGVTKLTETEHLLDVALKNTNVSIWEYNFKQRCIIQYQNSIKMHGFEQIIPNVPESLIESGFVHKDSVAAFCEMYEKLLKGAPFAEGVFKVQTSDRTGYWYEHIRYTNTFDANGNPYRAVGMSTDETLHQEAVIKYEREMERERGFMAEENLIVHATFDLTCGETLDYCYPDGTAVPIEEQKIFTCGTADAESLIDESERAEYLKLNCLETLLKRFADGENEFRQEYRKQFPDGSVLWVRDTMLMLKDPSNGHILLFAYWYNIENEKMLELMYRSVATANYDFVTRIDGKTKRFETLPNENISFHMPPRKGEDADEIAMSMFNDCIFLEDREEARENALVATIRKHLKDQERFVYTYRMTRPDGSIRYKKIIQYYVDQQREIIAVMREDITDLMQEENEQKRVLSEALSAANQASHAKSQFLSRVSHELRTPLNAIIGFLGLAKEADPEQIGVYLNHSDTAAKQLLSVINDVLDMSSIESGKMKIAHTLFNFGHLIKNTMELFEPQFKQKELRFQTIFQTPVEEWLLGDQFRVNQILYNLLNNALKFTEKGGVVFTISQRQSKRDDQVIVRFEISDTGCGMSDEMQKRLFKAFEQESAATAQKYGGNGLGLSIVGNLVSIMDGVIDVQSRQNEGSTFIVDLPFTRGEIETPVGTLEDVELLHVLIVDDIATEREYIATVLKRLSVRYTCVENCEDAFYELNRAIQENNEYNVCIADWNLSNEKGLDLARKIREKCGSEIVIIIASAYEHYQAEESVKAAGANLFVSKPMLQSVLFDLFSSMTGGRFAEQEDGILNDVDLSEMKLLVAEDNALNRSMIERILMKRFGIKCECAVDGKEALDMFLASEAGGYDAILMDVQMPNMDGYEATRQIRCSTHPDATKVQIIAVTANAFSEDITKSLACGMNEHISKPIDTEALGSALEKVYRDRMFM